MDRQGKWLLCPSCHSKTRVWLRADTVLRNFLLFCPKCRGEALIGSAAISYDDFGKARRKDAELNRRQRRAALHCFRGEIWKMHFGSCSRFWMEKGG